jgi:hypothetical protein
LSNLAGLAAAFKAGQVQEKWFADLESSVVSRGWPQQAAKDPKYSAGEKQLRK